jgi:transcriptional regulator with XRE-family HTH domain
MTPSEIGEQIKAARGKRSQRDIAAQAGVTRNQVAAVEKNSTNYTKETLWAVAKAVGVDIRGVKITKA